MSLFECQQQLGGTLLRPRPQAQVAAVTEANASALALYEELLFNTVCGTLEKIYPFTHQLLTHNQADESQWRFWAEDFRRACPNRSYSLMGAVSHFPEFLTSQPALLADLPFIADLARYEWLEMAVLNDPESALPDRLESMVAEPALFDHYQPVWNPVRRLHTFSYNIPALLDAWKASPQYVLEAPLLFQNSLDILIYRDPRTLDARFFVLNELTATLLRLSVTEASYEMTLTTLQSEIPALSQVPVDVLKYQAHGLLKDCLGKGILMGSLPSSVQCCTGKISLEN